VAEYEPGGATASPAADASATRQKNSVIPVYERLLGMKSSNTIVTGVVIVAVLIAAYGVGLLIQHARMGSTQPPAATNANDAKAAKGTARPGPGGGQTKDSPEVRAKVKESHAEMIEKMEKATEEEKAKFKEQVRERVSGPRNKQPPKVQEPNSSQKAGAEPNAAGRS
jgi:hypothetical protein